MNTCITKVDNKLRYSVKVNYRDVLASICVNELKSLLDKVDFIQDRLMLQNMICHCERLIGTDRPLGDNTVCNIYTPYVEPECCHHGRVIYNLFQTNKGIEEAPIDGKQYARQNAQWSEVKGGSGVDMETNLPLVKPVLMVTWTNNRTGETSNELNITRELGDIYTWVGSYMWTSKKGFKDPVEIRSNTFQEMTASGVQSKEIEFQSRYDQHRYISLMAPKTGYEVIDGSLVPATGQDEQTVTSNIDLLYPTYYGVKGNMYKKLASSNDLTLENVTTNSWEYFVYKYPANLPKLTTITLNDTYNVTQAFNYSEEPFTSDTGLELTMRVYTSDNPGAFTNAKLNFK